MAKNKETIEHSDKNAPATTKDALDLGVPMQAVDNPAEYSHPGPEDALDPEASSRGDYAGRLGEGESYQAQVVGHRTDGSPIIEMVRQK